VAHDGVDIDDPGWALDRAIVAPYDRGEKGSSIKGKH
jgi:hypothetical protein